MTKVGIDLAYPPSLYVAGQASQLGYTFCICYTGGVGALAKETWHIVDGKRYPVGKLVKAGYFPDGWMPTYVPSQAPSHYNAETGLSDADDANVQQGACGFDSTSPIFLDIEYSMYANNPSGVLNYIPTFVENCNAAGHPVEVYGSQALVNYLVDHGWIGPVVDGVWGADPVLTNRVNPQSSMWLPYDPSLPPPWNYWQCGNGTIAGTSVDFDTALDTATFATYAGALP